MTIERKFLWISPARPITWRRTEFWRGTADYYDRRHTEHVARRAVQMLEQQGYRVTLERVA